MKIQDIYDSVIYYSKNRDKYRKISCDIHIAAQRELTARYLVYEIYSLYFDMPIGQIYKPVLF